MQGCKRDDTKPPSGTAATDLSSQMADLAKLDTNYYQPLPEPVPAIVAPATGGNASTGYQAIAPSTTIVTPPPASEPPPVAIPAETKEYTIVRNDTLVKIAKAHHLTVGDITRANPGINPKRLIPGKKIQLPATSSLASPGGLGFAEPSKPELGGSSEAGIHEVKKGETLTKIAKQHSVTVKALRAANGLRTDRLHVGQKLKLPAGSASTGGAATMSEPPGSATTTLSARNPAGAPAER
jgi:LysM repeat protein